MNDDRVSDDVLDFDESPEAAKRRREMRYHPVGTIKGRKRLYKVVNAWRHDTRLDWPNFFEMVFGKKVAFGKGYEDNFRAGKISRKRAWQIYEWLSDQHNEWLTTRYRAQKMMREVQAEQSLLYDIENNPAYPPVRRKRRRAGLYYLKGKRRAKGKAKITRRKKKQ